MELHTSLGAYGNDETEVQTVGLKARTQNMQFQFHDQCLFSIWGKINKYFRYIEFGLATWHPFWDMQPVNSGSPSDLGESPGWKCQLEESFA